MNEHKHTPGPWEADSSHQAPQHFGPITHAAVRDADGHMICFVDKKENAPIIAAAPAMLKELEDLEYSGEPVYYGIYPKGTCPRCKRPKGFGHDANRTLNAALSAARGSRD